MRYQKIRIQNYLRVIGGKDLFLVTILDKFAIDVWPYRYGRIPQNQDFKISLKFLIGIFNDISKLRFKKY